MPHIRSRQCLTRKIEILVGALTTTSNPIRNETVHRNLCNRRHAADFWLRDRFDNVADDHDEFH